MKIISNLRKLLNPRKESTPYAYQKEKIGRLKAIYMLILVIVIIISFSFVGSMTGYFVYSGGDLRGQVSDLESQLSEANDMIDMLTGENTSCVDELDATEERALKCENDLLETETQLSECSEGMEDAGDTRENLNYCIKEMEEIEEDLEREKENFDNLVRNSVQAKCCSVSDINTGEIRKWDVKKRDIVCSDSGEYKVDCKTGETDY